MSFVNKTESGGEMIKEVYEMSESIA